MNDLNNNPAQPMQPAGVAPMATPDPVASTMPPAPAMPEPMAQAPVAEPVMTTPSMADAPVMPAPMSATPAMPAEPVVTSVPPVTNPMGQ